jgi:N6-L-threonylcarbamoyladenine synthase
MTRILAIETSCDETAAAVVDGRQALSNVVASQIELHRRFGGVFPEVASRQHVLAIQTVVEQALEMANVAHVRDLDAIAVTRGPGLVGSLLVGVNAAKGLAFASGLPLLPVNHLEGHIYSNWIEIAGRPAIEDLFPAVILIVSGGHTELLLMSGHCQYRRLGGTLDDAAGEAFDKVARLLDLGFPGGPAIQQAAQTGDAQRFSLPRGLMHSAEHRFDFSFSGLKTAVVNLVNKQRPKERAWVQAGEHPGVGMLAADIASSFQLAVAEVLIAKTADAAQTFNARQVCICGGVSANAGLRQLAEETFAALQMPVYIPPLALCTDNAAMIGAAALYRWQHHPGFASDLSLDVSANLPLS